MNKSHAIPLNSGFPSLRQLFVVIAVALIGLAVWQTLAAAAPVPPPGTPKFSAQGTYKQGLINVSVISRQVGTDCRTDTTFNFGRIFKYMQWVNHGECSEEKIKSVLDQFKEHISKLADFKNWPAAQEALTEAFEAAKASIQPFPPPVP